jgi:hypothetical protein
MPDRRERLLKRAMEAMDENTKAGAIDRALQHYLGDLEAKREVAHQLSREQIDTLSTPQLKINRTTKVNDSQADAIGD